MNSNDPLALAEALLDLAEGLKGRTVVQMPGPLSEFEVARIKLALALAKKPKSVQLRAICEGWNIYRLINELY